MPPKRKCVHQDTLGTQQKQRSHKSQNFRQDTQPSHDDDHIPPPSHNNCASPPSLCPSSTQLQDKQGSKNNQKGDTSLQRPRTNDKPLLVNLIDTTFKTFPKRKQVRQDQLETQGKQETHNNQNLQQHTHDHAPPPSRKDSAIPSSLFQYPTQSHDNLGSNNDQIGNTSAHRPCRNDKPLLVDLMDATRNGAITSRKLCAREVWNIPQHLKVIVPFNLKGQGIKGGGRLFTRFLGLLACNSRYAPIHVTDWEWIPQENKVEIWRIIEEKFSFDYAKGKFWSMMSLGKLWRDYKHRLKCKYFKKHDTKDELLANGPPGLSSVEWWSFVDRHFDEKGKKLSKQDVENRNKLEVPHTAGSKCDAKKANEMLCPDTTSVLTPSRLHCHRSDAATTSATISDTSCHFVGESFSSRSREGTRVRGRGIGRSSAYPASSAGGGNDTGNVTVSDREMDFEPVVRRGRGPNRIPPPPLNPADRTLLRIESSQAFTGGPRVVRIISAVIKTSWPGPYSTWGEVPPEFKEICFNDFMSRYRFETEQEAKNARAVYHNIATERTTDNMYKVRDKAKRELKSEDPLDWKGWTKHWFHQDCWDSLCDQWALDEWQKRSDAAAQNRHVGEDEGLVRNRGGSISMAEHKRRMEAELGRPVSAMEVFDKLHKDNHGQYVDSRSKTVRETYNRRVQEKYSGKGKSSQVPKDLDTSLWLEASGGLRKGHIYGFGNSMTLSTQCSRCSLKSPPTPQQITFDSATQEYFRKMIAQAAAQAAEAATAAFRNELVRLGQKVPPTLLEHASSLASRQHYSSPNQDGTNQNDR